MKKLILSIIILFFVILSLAGAGFFYWQQSQNDVRDLNKTLPEGVKVVKSLTSKEYKVVNKIDNYEFKIPPEWQGVKEIKYFPEQEEENRVVRSIYLEGLEGTGRIISVDVYNVNQQKIELDSWANDLLIDFDLSGELKQEKIGDYNIFSTIEKEHLAGACIAFLYNNSNIYVFTSRSEEFIHYIINNGKW